MENSYTREIRVCAKEWPIVGDSGHKWCIEAFACEGGGGCEVVGELISRDITDLSSQVKTLLFCE